jgi:flavorubredoxin
MKIGNNIHSVGVNDEEKVLFEGLWPIPYGVSYNSYIIDDEDCVAKSFPSFNEQFSLLQNATL